MLRSQDSRKFLIGAPLFIISVFCFAFVLMQPRLNGHVQASSQSKNLSSKAKSSLPAVSINPDKNQPANLSSSNDSAAVTGGNPAATTAASNAQQAAPNNQSGSAAKAANQPAPGPPKPKSLIPTVEQTINSLL